MSLENRLAVRVQVMANHNSDAPESLGYLKRNGTLDENNFAFHPYSLVGDKDSEFYENFLSEIALSVLDEKTGKRSNPLKFPGLDSYLLRVQDVKLKEGEIVNANSAQFPQRSYDWVSDRVQLEVYKDGSIYRIRPWEKR